MCMNLMVCVLVETELELSHEQSACLPQSLRNKTMAETPNRDLRRRPLTNTAWIEFGCITAHQQNCARMKKYSIVSHSLSVKV